MINPLDALASLHTGGIGSLQMPVTPTTPALPGAPVSESFSSLLPSTGAVSPSAATGTPASLAIGDGSAPTNWGHMVQQMVLNVNDQQQSAAAKVTDVLRGGPTPVHEAMIATEQASLSFEFLAEVRNKITDAYQQVMQMQV